MRKTLLGMVLLALVCAVGIAWAGEHGHEGFGFGFRDGDGDRGGEHHGGKKRPKQLAVPVNAPKVWKTECGSCHMTWMQQADVATRPYPQSILVVEQDD